MADEEDVVVEVLAALFWDTRDVSPAAGDVALLAQSDCQSIPNTGKLTGHPSGAIIGGLLTRADHG